MRMLRCLTITALLWLACCGGAAFASQNEYRIGSGDVVRIKIYDHPDLESVLRVDGNGRIQFPLAGQLDVGGKTTSEAAVVIANALSGDYVINPQVSVFIEQFRSKKVVIIGEVTKPGMYELNGPTSLLELISLAGGLRKEAGTEVTIRRAVNKDTAGELLKVDLQGILESGQQSVDVPLFDGDTITVPLGGMVYVTGEVRKPAAYRLERGTTVIKAITMAGGFTELAAKGRITIVRKLDGREQELSAVPLNEPLLAEDVVVVPESFF